VTLSPAVEGIERALLGRVRRAPVLANVSEGRRQPHPERPRDRLATIPSDMSAHARQSREWTEERSESGIRARDLLDATARDQTKRDVASPYWGAIGGPDRVVVLALPCSALHIPRRGVSGFILCRVTGSATAREILQHCGLPMPVALAALRDLAAEGVVAFQ
jgi:hypothetical protein